MSTKLNAKIENLLNEHRYLADRLTEGIWVVDAETLKFEYATESLQRISGYTAEEYMNLTIRDRLTPSAYKVALSALIDERKKRDLGEAGVRTLELEMVHKDGSIYWIEVTAKFITGEGGRLKIVGSVREISERKRAEAQQRQLIEKLEEALAEKERLLKEIKILKGLLPICSGCKRIRDEAGKWWPLDAYVRARTNAELTHTICGDCRDVFYP